MFIKDNVAIISNGLVEARATMLVFPLAGSLIIFVTLFQAIGNAQKAGMLIILRQVVLFIPLTFILPMIANLNSLGVFASFALTDIVVFLIAILSTVKVFKTIDSQN